MALLIATTNPDKLREIRRLLTGAAAPVLGLQDFPAVPEPDETGGTFEENARLKALYYDGAVARPAGPDQRSGEPLLTVAEDSGLAIDGLAGEPGVRSARFLGPSATYPQRFAEIERRLALRPGVSRRARFVCALAAVRAGAVVFETRGTIEGVIAHPPRGDAGFGYDPIFEYPPFGRTLAEVDEATKLTVAHRTQAFRALEQWIRASPALA